jgi:hypothetical protein
VAGFAALETRAARAARGSRALRRRVRHLRPTSFVFSVAIEGRDPNESRDAVCADVDRSDVSDRRVFSKNELAFREDANARPSSRAPRKRTEIGIDVVDIIIEVFYSRTDRNRKDQSR